jgi:hypothetical protein
MPRKKRKKKPKINPKTLARPRLDALLARRRQGDLDDDGFVAGARAMMGELGLEPVMNALVAQLNNADDAQRELLIALVPKLDDQKVIAYLWRLVEKSRMSVGAKMTTLVILKGMGEQVDLEDVGRYFSWRDIKTADIAEVERLGRVSTRAIIRELQQITDPQDLEAFMLQHEKITAEMGGGDEMQLVVIEDLVAMADAGAADFLLALVYTSPSSQVRGAARRALIKLAGQDVFPQSPVVKSLGEEPFYTAYCTDPAHPWQQQVSMLWERPGERVQALVFLLDFGHPWRGSIKDMFVTRYMTKREWQREFVAKGAKDIPQLQVPYVRARQFILDALTANKKHRQPLPPEYDQFLHLIERILNPAPEALAQAEALPIKDEWGLPEGPVVRGMQVINLDDGSPLVLLDDSDLDFE